MTMTANAVTVTSTPIAGVMLPSMNGAKTPAIAASPMPMPKASADTRWTLMPVATASSRLSITARVSVAEPRAIQIKIDEQHGAAAGDAARHPRRRESLAEYLDRAVLHLVPGNSAATAASARPSSSPGIERSLVPKTIVVHRLDHLRQPEEQNDRQHFRVLGREQPRNQDVIERQADQHEHREGERKDRNRIDVEQREQPERQISAQHQEIAMREIDDAHDAEHEIEPEAHETEVEAEQNAGEEGIDEHLFMRRRLGRSAPHSRTRESAIRDPEQTHLPRPRTAFGVRGCGFSWSTVEPYGRG